MRTMPAKGLSLFETLVVLCIIGALAGVVVVKYQQVMQAARESAVKSELSNIRTSIRLFKYLNNRYPANLREMIEADVMLPARIGKGYTGSLIKQRYLLPNAMDEQGNIIDAFGNPFFYEPVRGEVRATTEGYERW